MGYNWQLLLFVIGNPSIPIMTLISFKLDVVCLIIPASNPKWYLPRSTKQMLDNVDRGVVNNVRHGKLFVFTISVCFTNYNSLLTVVSGTLHSTTHLHKLYLNE